MIQKSKEKIKQSEASKVQAVNLKSNYEDLNGQEYYKYLASNYNYLWQRFTGVFRYRGSLEYSKSLTYAYNIISEATKSKSDPVLIYLPFSSALDSYKDVKSNIDITRESNIYNHSAPIFLYRLFLEANLALGLIALVALSVLSGYTMDKEMVNRLNLCILPHIRDLKYMQQKYLLNFCIQH